MRDWQNIILLAGGMAVASPAVFAQAAQAQNTIPDAQVESNVLKALASASELSTQNIQTSTVYGVVTLTGNVHDESLRVKAENLAARADGVKKVVDELTLGDQPAQQADQQQGTGTPDGGAPAGQVLQSDGTYAPAQPGDQNAQMQNEPGPPTQTQGPQPPQAGYPQQGYPQQAQQGYGDPNAYPQQGPPSRRPMYSNGYAPAGPQGGQVAGLDAVVPAGAPISIRINRGIDSQHIKPGTPFDGIVMQDVVANGAIAIPRGAAVQGTVVDAKKVGALSGHGELALQLNSLTLGGQVYPLDTVVWQQQGKDKTTGTVNRAVGLGVLGALVGAAAGGGAGAAIGAGVGGAAGVASSAGSPRGQIIIPPESIITFSLNSPAQVKTVSQQELGRLAYAAGPQPRPYPARRVYYSSGPYGPGYYQVPPPPPPQ